MKPRRTADGRQSTAFERDVLASAGRLLADAASLAELGLRPETYVRSHSGSSEIAIYFYRGDEPLDVLEFFVTRHGLPAATISEIEAWLREALKDVTERAREAT